MRARLGREDRERELRHRQLVRGAVGERLGDVLGPHGVGSRERGDRPRDPADAGVATSGEVEPVDGASEELVASRSRDGGLSASRSRAPRDALAHGGRRLARRRRELDAAHARHREDEVEAVEERARELVPVAREPLRRAAALGRRVAAAAAGTEVHRRRPAGTAPGRRRGPPARATETKPSSSGWRSASSAGRWNSGELVEEKHAAMREARLAGPQVRAAADDRGGRRAVVRRAERRRA